MTTDFSELLKTKRAELIAERDAALAELPAAREAYTAAFRGLETAQAKWNFVVARVSQATESSQRVLSAALSSLLDGERASYDIAGAEWRRAKDHLANLRWTVECRNHDIEQLQRLADPPKPLTEIVPRPKPEPVEIDDIIFPAAPSRAA
jgi:hypothetical protein